MVSITASLTTQEIADAIGCPKVVAKTVIQRMFNMNFFRNFPDTFNFFKADPFVVGRRQLYTGAESIYIGLGAKETDGTKAAVLAYIVKASTSVVDLTGLSKELPVAPVEPEPEPPVEEPPVVEPEPEEVVIPPTDTETPPEEEKVD